MNIHAIAAYLKKQPDPEAQAFYAELSKLYGYDITPGELKILVNTILDEEQKVYAIPNAPDQQTAMIEFNKKIKFARQQISGAMENITSVEKDIADHVLEEAVYRLTSKILGVDTHRLGTMQPVTKPTHNHNHKKKRKKR